jgi:hypothetical protein
MIYCIAVPVPASEKFRFRSLFRIRTVFSTVFQQKIVQNHAFSMIGAALFPESWPLSFYFLTLVFYVRMLDPDPNPVPVSLRRKVLVPVAQH